MVTQQRLKELLEYAPSTGRFTWRKPRCSRIRPEDRAGSYDAKGYERIALDGARYLSHRLAWLYVYGEMPEQQVDHINGAKGDNRIINLRLCSHAENRRNTPLLKSNSSGAKGVTYCQGSNKWRAKIDHNGHRISLGYYHDIELAELVAREAREKFHGEFANHGLVRPEPPEVEG